MTVNIGIPDHNLQKLLANGKWGVLLASAEIKPNREDATAISCAAFLEYHTDGILYAYVSYSAEDPELKSGLGGGFEVSGEDVFQNRVNFYSHGDGEWNFGTRGATYQGSVVFAKIVLKGFDKADPIAVDFLLPHALRFPATQMTKTSVERGGVTTRGSKVDTLKWQSDTCAVEIAANEHFNHFKINVDTTLPLLLAASRAEEALSYVLGSVISPPWIKVTNTERSVVFLRSARPIHNQPAKWPPLPLQPRSDISFCEMFEQYFRFVESDEAEDRHWLSATVTEIYGTSTTYLTIELRMVCIAIECLVKKLGMEIPLEIFSKAECKNLIDMLKQISLSEEKQKRLINFRSGLNKPSIGMYFKAAILANVISKEDHTLWKSYRNKVVHEIDETSPDYRKLSDDMEKLMSIFHKLISNIISSSTPI